VPLQLTDCFEQSILLSNRGSETRFANADGDANATPADAATVTFLSLITIAVPAFNRCTQGRSFDQRIKPTANTVDTRGMAPALGHRVAAKAFQGRSAGLRSKQAARFQAHCPRTAKREVRLIQPEVVHQVKEAC
jgi:hypothetical protein